MKIKRGFIIRLLLTSTIVTSMALSANPDEAAAESNDLKWTQIHTPGAVPDINDIVTPCEVNQIALGSDGKTFYAVDIPHANNITGSKALYKSTDSGISWSDAISKNLYKTMAPGEQINFHLWNIAVAPDDVNLIAVVTNDSTSNWPRNVWVSTNGGDKWENTNCPVVDHISTIEISPSYGNFDIAVGTRTGVGNGNVYIFKASGQGTWSDQSFNGDILAMKLSPNYINDSSLVIISSNATGTYLNIGIHDKAINTTRWDIWTPTEITTNGANTSPRANQIITADLELPNDFSGQAPGTRRGYISIDDNGAGNAGIYRFDNTTVYNLMTSTATRRISSIAYYGTYVSGKLLAGEILGNPCTATVMTWFTDSPTTCPIPCWYSAMKPPTGAAGTDNCAGSGYGNAQVAWSPDGSTAYVSTASSATSVAGVNWPVPYLSGEDLDESAFSLSRNNGETWNQLALIDTRISRFTDIAPAPDCSTLYLASTNDNTGCSGFDSVWRSQSSPIGNNWERILCQVTTSQHCTQSQSDNAIIRLAGDKIDGQTIFWTSPGIQKIMWSPDFGDYWTVINSQLTVQDMAIEDSETLYILNADGWVQKLTTSSGICWTSQDVVPSGLDTGYSITTAYTGMTPDNDKGHIIVGGMGIGTYDVAYSTDGGITFTPITTQLPTRGNTLVVIHSGYKSNGEVFAINSGGMYEWSIYYGGGTWSWPLPEKDRWSTQWGGPSWPTPVTGLTISRNGSFYFADSWGAYIRWAWANAGLDPFASFGTDPTTRLRICGSLEYGEPITVWLIDQRPYSLPQGGVWKYIDTLAWNGPTPTSPVNNAAVPYDPVSGRAGGLNLTWQPVSLSKGYRIQIAKDKDFALQVADIGGDWGGPFYTPPEPDAPALVIPPGGGTIIDANGNTWTVPALEAGHTYFWRVYIQDVATGDAIKSPWSWKESFTVKTGLQVTNPYYGPQLLSPDNGCPGCQIKSACFSWSPFQYATQYRFILARDAAMTDILVETDVPTTSYDYGSTLDYNTNYFWQVRAIEPTPSDWSAIFCFQTKATPVPQSSPRALQAASVWIWFIITIGVILDISLLILVIRRLSRQKN